MTVTVATDKGPDSQAVQVAEYIHNQMLPETTILFGSRARGDHRHTSDVDILLIVHRVPSEETRATAHANAEAHARTLYGTRTQVQLVWRTTEDFFDLRRNRNDLTARAMEEGIIMGPRGEEFSNRFSEEYQYDEQHDWNVTDQRIRNSENHLISFNSLADSNMPDESVGSLAHAALEHALKAVIAASGVRYEGIHHINMLRGQLLDADKEFDYDPILDGSVYQQYRANREYYDAVTPLTDVPGYQAIVTEEVESLLGRARELRRRQH